MQAATGLQTYTYSIPLKNSNLMPALVVQEEMKKRQGQKKEYFLYGMNLVNGIRNCKGPKIWNIYNGRIHKGENVRVFPISNWTELDIWNYIRKENIGFAIYIFCA